MSPGPIEHPRGSAGPLLVALGVLFVVVGLLAWSGALSWFGRLPGDIRVERPGVRIYVPIVSTLLASIALTVLLNLLRRFF